MKYKWKVKNSINKDSEEYEYTVDYLQENYPKNFDETLDLYTRTRSSNNSNKGSKFLNDNNNKQVAYESFLGMAFDKEKATGYLAESFIEGYGVPKGNDYLIKLTIKIGINLGDSYCVNLSNLYNFNDVTTLANQLVKEIKLNAEILQKEEIDWGQAFMAADKLDKMVKNSSGISYFDYIPRDGSLPVAEYTVNIESDTGFVGENSSVANQPDSCCVVL